jgi:hypothetical protein
MKALEREVRELRKANEILKAASVFFAKELDPTEVSALIDAHRERFGVELVCQTLGASGLLPACRRSALGA